MPAVSVNNLTVQYGDSRILDGLTFDIVEGSITAIIGPNGSGKTTLLKALLGLISYRGDIKVFGQATKNVRHEIGYVPQRFTFDKSFPITVNEFMTLASDKKYFKKDIQFQLKEVGMWSAKDQLIGSLSGGQLQRVLIANALLNGPKIVFLDEAASGIDIKGERSFFELIKHLNEDHQVTIVFVSHEVDIVHRYATQVLCLNKKMICMGKPAEVLTTQTLQKLYDINISLYSHQNDKHS